MAITNRFTDIAVAIREKTGKSAMLQPADMPAEIRSISGGGGGGWQPPADWWDIKTMVDTGVLEWSGAPVANVRYGYVVSDGHPTTKLVAGYEYYLSDGSYYNGAAEVVHTWDRSKDKPCAEGYMTRAVIVAKAANRDVAISQRSLSLDGIASLFIYLGDCNVITLVGSREYDSRYSNQILQAVLCNEHTTSTINMFGEAAFSYCWALAAFTFPRGTTNIGEGTFSSCTCLQSITLPDNITRIESSTFASCVGIRTLSIPDNVTSIGDYAFDTCAILTEISIPDTVTSIGEGAFYYCGSLRTLSIPHDITSIGEYAFEQCLALVAFNVPIGFNLSVELHQSPHLSISSLEQLIDNAADMTGQTAITFTLGADNLAKLSDEYKALAAAKNITLA